MKISTQNNLFACDECGKTYSDKGDLKKHKTSHAGPVQCDLCDKTVKSTFRLSRHISSMHGDDAEMENLSVKFAHQH